MLNEIILHLKKSSVTVEASFDEIPSMTFFKDAVQQLKKQHYKITGPRLAVLKILSESDTSLSAYEIQKQLSKTLPVNVVTVYRVLEVLERLKIIHHIHIRDGYVRCRFKQRSGCHYFAVCRQCGCVMEFLHASPCLLKTIVPRQLPFKQLTHLTEISGICERCVPSK